MGKLDPRHYVPMKSARSKPPALRHERDPYSGLTECGAGQPWSGSMTWFPSRIGDLRPANGNPTVSDDERAANPVDLKISRSTMFFAGFGSSKSRLLIGF